MKCTHCVGGTYQPLIGPIEICGNCNGSGTMHANIDIKTEVHIDINARKVQPFVTLDDIRAADRKHAAITEAISAKAGKPTLPKGRHQVTVTAVVKTENSSGRPLLRIEMEKTVTGERHTAYLAVGPASMWKLKEFSDAIGTQEIDQMAGRRMTLDVGSTWRCSPPEDSADRPTESTLADYMSKHPSVYAWTVEAGVVKITPLAGGFTAAAARDMYKGVKRHAPDYLCVQILYPIGWPCQT